MATRDSHVSLPLMIRNQNDIQFVEDDNDTVSDNEPSTGVTRNAVEGNVYSEIPERKRKLGGYLEVPRFSLSRSNSSASSSRTSPTLERKGSKKKISHEYEKVSVTSASSKKSTVERIAESAFFRRRTDTAYDRRGDSKGEEDEHILESLRQVVRKCTNVDPVKRPGSTDVLEWLVGSNEKS